MCRIAAASNSPSLAQKQARTQMNTPSQPATAPEISMRALLAGARRKEAQLLALAEKLVRAESPSDTKSAVDACGQLAIAHARALGGRVKVHKQRAHGDVLELRFGSKSK